MEGERTLTSKKSSQILGSEVSGVVFFGSIRSIFSKLQLL